jgi:thiamine-monophosphate kinase
LSVTVQLQGYVEPGKALRRDAARAGHALFVSGTLGDAACALHQLQTANQAEVALLKRLNRPRPRVELGQMLRGVASAAIDISDGLLADLGHILEASGCGATLWSQQLPASAALQALPEKQRLEYQFNGGDDYELCFSVEPGRRAALQILQQQSLPVTEIGVIEAQPGLRCRYPDGHVEQPNSQGFDHFRRGGHD